MNVVFYIESVPDANMAADFIANIFSGKRNVDCITGWKLKRGLYYSVLLEALSARDEIPREYIDGIGIQILDEIELEF